MSGDGQRLIASYGRRHGRKLRVRKQGLIDTLLPRLSLSLPEQGGLDVAALFKQQIFWLEIGFGGGEHLAHQAGLHPEVGIIGCEPYVNGIAGLLAHIETNGTDNIRIYTQDARFVVERLPAASISRVFVLYPDPWPKARHHKRRLISHPFLNDLARVMKSGAELRLATDDVDYCTWMLEHVLSHPDFIWQATSSDDWLKPPPDWISTRYEQKALQAGRKPVYLNFIRS